MVSPRMSLNTFPRPYAIPKNTIIRSKHDASARHPKTHAIPYTESTVTCPKVITKMVFFTFPFANPFCCLFCNFFLLHNLSKHYSVRLMTPVLCNSPPISQKGVVAVLCPVAVLGTFPILFFLNSKNIPKASLYNIIIIVDTVLRQKLNCKHEK